MLPIISPFPLPLGAGFLKWNKFPEPEFVNVQGAQELIPPAYVAWQAGTSNRFVVPDRQAGNRFLGSLKSLHIRDQNSILKRF